MIREAVVEDIPYIIELGREMVEEGRYRHIIYSEERTEHFVQGYIESPNRLLLVSEIKGRICGFFFGFIERFNFSYDIFASEELWYMQKNSRGKRDGALMIKKFIEWGKMRGVAELQVTITLCVDNKKASKVVNAFGFVSEGEVHKMRLV